jgi:galactonate dehydratase
MDLADFKTFVVHDGYRSFVFLKLYADSGETGLGEGTVEWSELAVEAELRQLCARLRGRDLRRIEAIWDDLYHETYWRGSLIIHSAISAIDQALWDLKGKTLGQPVHELLGGRTRDRLRAYANAWYGGCAGPDELAARARSVVEAGFSALKWDPFGNAGLVPERRMLRQAVENVAAVREAVGPDVDLLIEGHGRFAPAWAMDVAEQLKPLHPYFFEEPVPPENVDALAQVAARMDIPVATGERYTSRFQFRELLEKRAAAVIQPDLCHAGGITEVKKIAALAQAHYVMVAPHNSAGPVGTAAAIQIDATIPNFLIQEFFVAQAPWIGELVTGAVQVKDGYIAVPDAPGLGVELNEEEAVRHPFQEYWGGKSLYSEGWEKAFGLGE